MRNIAFAAILMVALIGGMAPDQPVGQPYSFSAEKGFAANLGAKPAFTPKVPDHRLRRDLSDVANLAAFTDRLRPEHLKMIARNGFCVAGADWKQLEFVYELNNYSHQHLPSFVTVDSTLHSFHVFFDYCLRTVETGTLYERAETLSRGLLAEAASRYASATSPELKEAARDNFAYALVPCRLLAIPDEGLGVAIPAEVTGIADAELKLIAAHEGFMPSPSVGFAVDYSQFVPRGHYTRSEKLQRYFKAMMWYGLVPVAFRNLPGDFAPTRARQATLLADTILYGKAGDEPLGKVWEDLYEPTAFLVGFADDITPGDFGKAIPRIFGEPTDMARLIPTENLEALAADLLKLRPPGIVMASITSDPQYAGVPQLRVMGQRFIYDSYLFQQMVVPFVGAGPGTATEPETFGKRTFPMGLDVMSILGSKRAYDIADKVYQQTKFAHYAEKTDKLRAEVAAFPAERWSSSVYYGWLDTLHYLLQVKRDGYPQFMRDEAWTDKQLNAALGSWAELRHDTILYAKQSVVAECGGEGGDKNPPTPPKGYVEPEVLTYWRLKLLAAQLRDGLRRRGLVKDEAILEPFNELVSLLGFLEQVSIKELGNGKLSADEYQQIEYYGDTVSRLNLFTKKGMEGDEITSMTDKDMAVIADVHSGPIGSEMFALEEGVGHANEIYVVYPCEGKLLMGRGAVFSYYEFTQLANDRLTDEKWQGLIGSKAPPRLPLWVKGFYGPPVKGKTGAGVEGDVAKFTKGGC